MSETIPATTSATTTTLAREQQIAHSDQQSGRSVLMTPFEPCQTFKPRRTWLALCGILTVILLGATWISSTNNVDAQEKSKAKSTKSDSKSEAEPAKKETAKKETANRETPKKETSEKETSEKTSKGGSNLPAPGRRLPAGYSALDLTDEQKEKIFKVRESHAKKLETLQQQLDEQRAKMEKDFEEVLTDKQKKQLADAKEESSRKGSDSARKSATRKSSAV